jgi:membrane-associated phospholipid phosphatase
LFLQAIRTNAWFFVPFTLFVLVGGYTISAHEKVALFHSINSAHSPFLDRMFLFMSAIPEWYGWVATAMVALVVKVRYGIFAIVALLLTGLLSQLLKHYAFPDELRPSGLIDIQDLNLVLGVDLHRRFSFPSGHTTAAFCMYSVLSLISSSKYKKLGALYFILALGSGASRVYLNQHFPVDVLAGSVLGVGFTLVCYVVGENLFKKRVYPWAEKSVVTHITGRA